MEETTEEYSEPLVEDENQTVDDIETENIFAKQPNQEITSESLSESVTNENAELNSKLSDKNDDEQGEHVNQNLHANDDKRNVPTPESNYKMAKYTELKSPEKKEISTNRSMPLNRLNLPSNIKMVSTEPMFGVTDGPPGFGEKRTFYIYQNIPKPSTPLKVWRGYYGNIYFEPVKIESPPSTERPKTIPQAPRMNRCTPKTQNIILNSRWNSQHVESQRRHEQEFRASQQDYVAQLEVIRLQKRSQKNTRSMLHLDRKALLSSKANPQDMLWLKKGNSIGTLRFTQREDSCLTSINGRLSRISSTFPVVSAVRQLDNKVSTPSYMDKRRICQGSVSRKLVELRQLMETSPFLKSATEQ